MAKFTPLYEEQSLDFNPTVEFRGLALKLCHVAYKIGKVIPISPNRSKRQGIKCETPGVHRICNKC